MKVSVYRYVNKAVGNFVKLLFNFRLPSYKQVLFIFVLNLTKKLFWIDWQEKKMKLSIVLAKAMMAPIIQPHEF